MLRELNAAAAPPLADDGQRVHVVASGGACAVLDVRLAPGAGSPARRHDREDQWLIVVQGELTLVLDGHPTRLRPGDRADVPRGVPHRITAGPAGARLLRVLVPGGYDRLVAALQDPAIGADDRAALLAAAGVHAVAARW